MCVVWDVWDVVVIGDTLDNLLDMPEGTTYDINYASTLLGAVATTMPRILVDAFIIGRQFKHLRHFLEDPAILQNAERPPQWRSLLFLCPDFLVVAWSVYPLLSDLNFGSYAAALSLIRVSDGIPIRQVGRSAKSVFAE